MLAHFDSETSPGSGTGTGTPTFWQLGDARSGNHTQEDYAITMPGGTFNLMDDAWGNATAPIQDFATGLRQIVVGSGITLQGEVDGSNVPKTKMRFLAATPENADYLTHGLINGFFHLNGTSDGMPKVKSIEFNNAMTMIIAWSPNEVENCRFYDVQQPFRHIMDDRDVYPNLTSSVEDFTSPNLSLMKDCLIDGMVQWLHLIGGGLTVQNLTAQNIGASVITGQTSVGTTGLMAADPDFHVFLFGLTPGTIQTKYCRDVVLENGTYTNASPKPGAVDPEVLTFGFSQFGGVMEKVEIRGNNVSDWPVSEIFFNGGFAFAAFFAERMRDISVINNTWTRSGPLFAAGGILSPPSTNYLVSGNTVDADVGGTGSAPVVSSVVMGDFFFGEVHDCTIAKNDYTDSGHPSLAVTPSIDNSAILLLPGANFNTIFESDSFPAGQGGAKNHVTDLGLSNRIVGERANTADKPAGIGDTIRSTGLNRLKAQTNIRGQLNSSYM